MDSYTLNNEIITNQQCLKGEGIRGAAQRPLCLLKVALVPILEIEGMTYALKSSG